MKAKVANRKLPQARKPKGIMLEPGKGYIADWVNRYTLSLFPFTAGLTALRILPANPMRTYLLIQNTSASNMFVNFGQNATPIAGIRIIPGGNYEQLGGAPAGAFIAPDDVYILGAAASLSGVIAEGLWTSVYV
jgi:hypothetical protein